MGSDEPPYDVVYRGQSDESWPLVPSSRRRANWPFLGITSNAEHTLLAHSQAEAQNFLNFTEKALMCGLTVPYRANGRGDILEQIGDFARGRSAGSETIEAWPPDLAVSAPGLAQHAGLHTCLLDFTLNPYVAAYFAARERIVVQCATPVADQHKSLDIENPQDQIRSPCIAVWVVAYRRLTLNESATEPPVIMRPPGFENPTLQAQEGVFLYAPQAIPVPTAITDSGQSISKPLDEFFDRSPDPENPSIVKLVMNARYAGKLMQKLTRLGIWSARLLPTYEGVVKSLLDHHYLGVRFDF